jgi:hypothetical protein
MRVMLTAHEPFALERRELSCRSFGNHEITTAIGPNASPVNLEFASKQQLSNQLLERNPVGWKLFEIQHR